MHGLTLDGIYLGTAAVNINSNAGRKLIECVTSVPRGLGFGSCGHEAQAAVVKFLGIEMGYLYGRAARWI